MNIFETLKADHVETRGLLEDIIKLTLEPISDVVASEDWAQAFEDLKRKLFAHDRAEEAVFYDALDTLGHSRELAETKTEEHHAVESLLIELERMSRRDFNWDRTLGLLKNQLESHIAEEETMVFKVLSAFVDDDTSDKMAKEFIRLRDGTSDRTRDGLSDGLHDGSRAARKIRTLPLT